MLSKGAERAKNCNPTYRWRAEDVEVILDGVQSEFPELVAHQDSHGIEEALQIVQGDQVPLVALVKNVLDFRKPPVQENILYVM